MKLLQILIVSLLFTSHLEAGEYKIPKYRGGAPHNPRNIRNHVRKHTKRAKEAKLNALRAKYGYH